MPRRVRVFDFEQKLGIDADEGIAAPVFPALDTFEQEHVRVIREAPEHGDRCFEIGQHFLTDRDQVIFPGQCDVFL